MVVDYPARRSVNIASETLFKLKHSVERGTTRPFALYGRREVARTFEAAGFRVTDPLQDGQHVAVGTATITALHIPGHTGGSAAYLFHDVLFLGDSANGRADGTVVSAPWVVSDDVDQNVASLTALRERLAGMGRSVKTLAFGHSGPKKGEGVMSVFMPKDEVTQ